MGASGDDAAGRDEVRARGGSGGDDPGARFEAAMGRAERRARGAHYTPEAGVLRVLRPLVLDELARELAAARGDADRLAALQARVASATFLDPACGCGAFLAVAYREVRALELEALTALAALGRDARALPRCDPSRMFGIELDPGAAAIAREAVAQVDREMDARLVAAAGEAYARGAPAGRCVVACGDALALDWREVTGAAGVDHVVGNPPFVGKKSQSAAQRRGLAAAMGGARGAGVLDYAAAWFAKAADFMARTAAARARPARCAFVATSSLAQGEQVGVLAAHLAARGAVIHFAHRPFRWPGDPRAGGAAVQCVVVGFALFDAPGKVLFEYATPRGEPVARPARRISAYLAADHADVVVRARRAPLCEAAPAITYGSFALDDGALTLTGDARDALLAECPEAARYVRAFVGAEELVHGAARYCLWLPDATEADLARLPPAVRRRVDAVRAWRAASPRAATRRLASAPWRFAEVRQPDRDYVAIPTLSSERRAYIPLARLPASTVASNQVYVLPGATPYHLGVLQSAMHMAWVRAVCGTLEGRHRYSIAVVYHNFPWPDAPGLDDAARRAVERAAEGVLAARARHPGASLARLYAPGATPRDLTAAHRALDRAVDAAYGQAAGFASDAARLAHLFERYARYAT